MDNITKDHIRVALIGCGRISQVHLHALAKEPRVRLVAAADVDRRAVDSVAEAFGIRGFTVAEHMLGTVRPDAVVLCTPPNTHRVLSELALASGAHVLCEKPLATGVEDAEAMMTAAAEAGRHLMMASKFRYVSDIVLAKGMAESGLVGKVTIFQNEFCSFVDMKNRWNAKREMSGGGVLIDNGSHTVDIIRYLVGPVTAVQAVFGRNWQGLSVEETCQIAAQCGDGVLASALLSWSMYSDGFYVHLFGTEGVLEVGWKESRYRRNSKFDWVSFGSGYDKNRAVAAQLSNFIEVMKGEAPPLIGPEDALESVRVIQAAYHAAQGGRWEQLSQMKTTGTQAAVSIPLH